MLTEFSRDLLDDRRQIDEVVAERPGKPIRLRLQPMILRSVAGKGGQYHAWKDVRWTLECDTPEEVFMLRDALRIFFETVGRLGPAAVTARLAGTEDGKEGTAA